jgi:hypothetical protein
MCFVINNLWSKKMSNLINPVEIKAREFLLKIRASEIANEGDNLKACEMLKNINSYVKTVKSLKAEEEKPIKSSLKEISDKYKNALDFLTEAEKILRSKIADYAELKLEKLNLIASAAQKTAEEEALRKLDELQALRESAGQYDEVTQAAIISSIDSKVNAVIDNSEIKIDNTLGNSAASFRKYITFKIVDIQKVPAEFLSVDTKAVNTAIRNGVREIPGLEIVEKLTPVVK